MRQKATRKDILRKKRRCVCDILTLPFLRGGTPSPDAPGFAAPPAASRWLPTTYLPPSGSRSPGRVAAGSPPAFGRARPSGGGGWSGAVSEGGAGGGGVAPQGGAHGGVVAFPNFLGFSFPEPASPRLSLPLPGPAKPPSLRGAGALPAPRGAPAARSRLARV